MFRRRRAPEFPPVVVPEPDPRFQTLVDELVRVTDLDEIVWVRESGFLGGWTWTSGEIVVSVALGGWDVTIERRGIRMAGTFDRRDLALVIRRWEDRRRAELLDDVEERLRQNSFDHEPF